MLEFFHLVVTKVKRRINHANNVLYFSIETIKKPNKNYIV